MNFFDKSSLYQDKRILKIFLSKFLQKFQKKLHARKYTDIHFIQLFKILERFLQEIRLSGMWGRERERERERETEKELDRWINR